MHVWVSEEVLRAGGRSLLGVSSQDPPEEVAVAYGGGIFLELSSVLLLDGRYCMCASSSPLPVETRVAQRESDSDWQFEFFEQVSCALAPRCGDS